MSEPEATAAMTLQFTIAALVCPDCASLLVDFEGPPSDSPSANLICGNCGSSFPLAAAAWLVDTSASNTNAGVSVDFGHIDREETP